MTATDTTQESRARLMRQLAMLVTGLPAPSSIFFVAADHLSLYVDSLAAGLRFDLETMRRTVVALSTPAVDNTDLIRRAIADPKQFTERWSPDCTHESLPSWQARAVVIALGGAQ